MTHRPEFQVASLLLSAVLLIGFADHVTASVTKCYDTKGFLETKATITASASAIATECNTDTTTTHTCYIISPKAAKHLKKVAFGCGDCKATGTNPAKTILQGEADMDCDTCTSADKCNGPTSTHTQYTANKKLSEYATTYDSCKSASDSSAGEDVYCSRKSKPCASLVWYDETKAKKEYWKGCAGLCPSGKKLNTKDAATCTTCDKDAACPFDGTQEGKVDSYVASLAKNTKLTTARTTPTTVKTTPTTVKTTSGAEAMAPSSLTLMAGALLALAGAAN